MSFFSKIINFLFCKSKTNSPSKNKDQANASFNNKDTNNFPHAKGKHILSIQKSASFITNKITSLLFNKSQVDHEMLVKLETLLIESDIQAKIAMEIIKSLSGKFFNKEITEKELKEFLAKELELYLMLHDERKFFDEMQSTDKKQPKVLMFIGINGAGKTTSIAKVASALKQNNKKVGIICGDTFRAAANQQLAEWANKLDIDYFSAPYKADVSGFIYHTIKEIQKTNQYDVLIIDTSGRLHSNTNLMEELSKLERVIKKLTPIDECLMVIDGSSGQNTITQIKEFKEYINITGIMITKLDTSAKGGVVVSIVHTFRIPVKLIGLGESEHDLIAFNAKKFIYNLLDLKKYNNHNQQSKIIKN